MGKHVISLKKEKKKERRKTTQSSWNSSETNKNANPPLPAQSSSSTFLWHYCSSKQVPVFFSTFSWRSPTFFSTILRGKSPIFSLQKLPQYLHLSGYGNCNWVLFFSLNQSVSLLLRYSFIPKIIQRKHENSLRAGGADRSTHALKFRGMAKRLRPCAISRGPVSQGEELHGEFSQGEELHGEFSQDPRLEVSAVLAEPMLQLESHRLILQKVMEGPKQSIQE
ncbi:uncharacterized protein [Spinacia oleracea]|uniref:Uncharacterized protein n=1 Tax=Spinacia oleracea TaxID=3562 RepID=A0ABM3RTU0_SPIOL|nr:uncharacterized protein LOC130472359 [Spinacia oleracea]XP_056699032.1 uncharacterized protein LOC130472359 [Spinacia oleracea]XP_056699033.1 uncharacterized protein LOC130472359 [Spinacia oleracea]XP_056699034.1 uncharacterized protein LOC130472359 [Spinacia oleracea]